MKNLNELVAECKTECDTLGIQYGNITQINVNTRFKKTWGQTKVINIHKSKNNKTHYDFAIDISSRLLEDNVGDMATKNTVMHEILHTVDGCLNHGAKWKAVADKVNKAYGYNIKRCTSSSEKGLEPIKIKRNYSKNYVMVCKRCGAEVIKHRMSNFVRYPQFYRHVNCNGTFERVQ